MLKKRIIPTLLLDNKQLVKTIKFSNPKYVGDPLNAIKIEVPKSGWLRTNNIGTISKVIGINIFVNLFISSIWLR